MATQVSDIKVYRNGSWHSLRGQKIYANGAWREFKSGCGVYKGGVWYTLIPTSSTTSVVVYVAPTVAEDKDGNMTWHFTVSSDPDVLSESDITVEGSVTMSDTGVYNISLTATADEYSVDTGIPYAEDVTIERVDLSAAASNENYTVSDVVFTGVYNIE